MRKLQATIKRAKAIVIYSVGRWYNEREDALLKEVREESDKLIVGDLKGISQITYARVRGRGPARRPHRQAILSHETFAGQGHKQRRLTNRKNIYVALQARDWQNSLSCGEDNVTPSAA